MSTVRQAGRLPDHGDGRDTRRDGSPDRALGRAPIAAPASKSPSWPRISSTLSPFVHSPKWGCPPPKRNVMSLPESLTTALGAALVSLMPLCVTLPAVAQGRAGALPDFTELYERQGPAVVRSTSRRRRGVSAFPTFPKTIRSTSSSGASARFRVAAGAGGPGGRTASWRRNRRAPASSSPPTVTSSPTRTSSTIERGHRPPVGQARIHRQGDRQRQAHRRGAAEDRREGPAAGRRSAIPTS